MRKKSLFRICAVFVIILTCMSSCMQGPEKTIIPEVNVPSGVDNYFKKSMDFESIGGEKLMIFSTNVKWSMQVTSTQNGIKWLTVTPASGGSGANSVTFSAQENTTSEDRSVVVLFTASDTIRSIIVNQKHLDALTLTSSRFEVSADGGNIEVEVNSTTDFNVTIPDDYKNWIHKSSNNTRALKASKIAFDIDPSDEYVSREGRIYITAGDKEEVVTIYQSGSGKLVLSQNEYNLTGSEQDFSVDISSNFDFSMEMPNVEWLKENTSKTRGMSSHSLKFKIDRNDDYQSRSAKIKIFDKNGSASEEIVVNQASIGAIITIETKEYNVSSDKQDLNIEVSSNFDYDVDFQGCTWIKKRSENTRGISSRLLKLTIDENESFDARTAKIKLYDKKSSASEEIIINQLSNSPTISVDNKDYELDSNTHDLDIEISSNVNYNVDFQGANWVKERTNTSRALTTSTLKLTIDANDSYDRRTANIKLYDKNSDVYEIIKISQNAKDGIEIPTKEYNIDELGGTLNIEVKANVDYKLTINNDWIKESQKTRALNSNQHQLIIDALGDNKDREGTITISNDELKFSETITIMQRRLLFFDKSEIKVLIGSEKTLSLTNLTNQGVGWSSSSTSIATVNKDGVVKGLSKGNATITAITTDGKHTATCEVAVCEITDLVNVYSSGGALSISNDLVQSGSKLNWTFYNGSPQKVLLKSLQLIDGITKKEGNEMSVNKEVPTETSVSYSTTIGILGIHLPVTCRFKFEYDGTEYYKEAVYEKSSWPF